MAAPQSGITAPTLLHHYALEYDVVGGANSEALREAILLALTFLNGQPGISHVLAFGPALCDALRIPGHPVSPFEEINGKDGKIARATQHDLLLWIQGDSRDRVFDVALSIHKKLSKTFQRELEIAGFIRAEARDLTGFIDGSANPKGDLITETAFVPDGIAGAGGAYVLTQKWQHNLPAFDSLSVPEQEKVIGRTKIDSIELEGYDMPPDSHVSRTDVAVGGETQRIYRRSFPYGTLEDHGLYFLAFAHDQNRFDLQLRRMYGVTEDGIRDRITDFSTAITGSYFFAPSTDTLREILS